MVTLFIQMTNIPDLSFKAFVAAAISAIWILWPVPVAKRFPRKYTATVYFLVLVGPVDSIILKGTIFNFKIYQTMNETVTVKLLLSSYALIN